jgi:K+-transporting ATPase ATPase C chain
MRSFLNSVRQLVASLRMLLIFTVLLGVGYPLLITLIAQIPGLHSRADGSQVTQGGKVVGSKLIGQSFTDSKGNPLPQYFQSRPSAAGTGYDPLSTSASNLGPENKDLIDAVKQRRATAARLDGVRPAAVPPDALQASGSGLDPQISPAYAREQIARVARERGLSQARVRALVSEHTQGRILGFLGEPRVNVLELNLALDRASRG